MDNRLFKCGVQYIASCILLLCVILINLASHLGDSPSHSVITCLMVIGVSIHAIILIHVWRDEE